MRILIVGAGVAGLTLAALLKRQGWRPVVIDKRPEDADPGYVLALWPHGTRILHALGLHDDFVARSAPMEHYALMGRGGRLIGSYDMQALIGSFGHLGIVSRPDFGNLLGRDIAVRHNVSVESLSATRDRVDVELTDGSRDAFDLVVGADGMHSRVRELLFGREPDRDTGFGCFVWWGDASLAAIGVTTEYWGAGRFLGLYPCRDRVGIIAGAPVEVLQPRETSGRTSRVRRLVEQLDAPADALLAGLPVDGKPLYLWRMADVRAPAWVRGRVALVGDAAAAFLPTAGIGASMALESAAALADELSRTDAAHLPLALDLYARRRTRRVLAAQDQSRWLARVMFVRFGPLATLRDIALRSTSMERMVGPILRQLSEPI